jgi:metal-responsive CopG/Arc/MetJ family transcriptional regulator
MPRKKVVKVTVSLPEDLYQTIEQERRAIGETRSEYVVRSIAQLLRQRQEAEWEEQYRRAYEKYPQTEEELAELDAWIRAGAEVWAKESPWEADGEE